MTKDEALKLALDALEQWNTPLYKRGTTITAIKEALAQPDEDEIIIQYHEATIKRLEKHIAELMAQPKQEPVAIYQFRAPRCSDWYDGIPDQRDGRGPYQTRTLYTSPPKREWVGLTDEEIINISCYDLHFAALIGEVVRKLKEKNL